MAETIVHVDGAEQLDRTLATAPPGPLAVLVLDDAPLDEAATKAVLDAMDRHRRVLADRCLGVAIVAAPGVRPVVADRAGALPLPVAVLDDDATARGWLAGQASIGVGATRRPGGDRTVGVTSAIEAYVLAHCNPHADPVSDDLARRTVERFGALAGMNVGRDEGLFLQLLVQLTGARRVAEVGTFTGMSALWLARGLPPGGRLTCFELRPEPIELAREAWRAADVDDRIDVVLGPAAESLAALPADWTIDLAFVDADKTGYATYLDHLLLRLNPGGCVVLDNTLWSGRVADQDDRTADTVAIRRLNDDLADRDDVDVVLLTVGDGVTLVRPRGLHR
jgi:caffeoyl-CoA O-methyltransferase